MLSRQSDKSIQRVDAMGLKTPSDRNEEHSGPSSIRKLYQVFEDVSLLPHPSCIPLLANWGLSDGLPNCNLEVHRNIDCIYIRRSSPNRHRIGNRNQMADLEDSLSEPIQVTLLHALAEVYVATGNREQAHEIDGLRLRATLRPHRLDQMERKLASLSADGWVDNLDVSGSRVSLNLTTKFPTPSVADDIREKAGDSAIKRALLFKLHEVYRDVGHRQAARFSLITLAEPLSVSVKLIQRLVMSLVDDGFLEYPTMDGGTCHCNLSPLGLRIAEDVKQLWTSFSTVQFEVMRKPDTSTSAATSSNPKKVFVVHGRNEKARQALFSFLRAIGLDPIEWGEAVAMTGKAFPYVGEVLDVALKSAQAIVVLFTGDDWATLDNLHLHPGEAPESAKLQPRPNVLLEAGMALGFNPDRTVVVELGSLRSLSDLAGRHAIRIDNTPEKKHSLVSRLGKAGCDVQTEGKVDWLSVDFEIAIPNSSLVQGVTHSSTISDKSEPSNPAITDKWRKLKLLLETGGTVATVIWRDERQPGAKECGLISCDHTSLRIQDNRTSRSYSIPLTDLEVFEDTKRNRPKLLLNMYIEVYAMG